MMKAKMWVVIGIVAAFVYMTNFASAAIIFSDDFPGSSLDGAKWTTAGDSISVASSVVSLGGSDTMTSIATFNPSDGEYTMNLTAWNSVHVTSSLMGFRDAASDNMIMFSTNAATDQVVLQMKSGGGATQTYGIQMSDSLFFQNNWTMTMSAGRVTFNNDIGSAWMPVPFDSDTIAPDGGGAWAIPTVGMNFFLQTGGFATTSLDAVSIDLAAVPEPGALTLASLGGLLFLRRRRYA